MVNSPNRTAYILLHSNDGITWTEAAKDRMLRSYSDEDIYQFNDKSFYPGKTYYRLRIFDGENNTIALSQIISVGTTRSNTTVVQPRVNSQLKSNAETRSKNTGIQTSESNSNSWVLYPNPATDFVVVEYKGRDNLKGIVNVEVQDGTGKTVVKFRSGSMYKTIQVPLPYLQRGAYLLQVSVLDKVVMSQRFIKQ